MNGRELKEARKTKGWTQEETAKRVGLTQAYFSMLERGRRGLPNHLARKVALMLDAQPTAFPLPEETLAPAGNERLRGELTALGYPGFSHLRGTARRNPAEVLLRALGESDLDSRVVEGLPWLALTYADLDWDWTVRNAKLLDRQNRLGFLTEMAYQLGKRASETHPEHLRKLKEYTAVLDRSRLAKEDTLCHDSLTEAERTWLRPNRPPEAVHWNLLTDMRAQILPYAAG